MRNRLIAGNWKMNGTGAELAEVAKFRDLTVAARCTVLVCPPSTLLHRMSGMLADSAVQTGGQDCHQSEAGAHTGDVSARMLADAGASHCIVGHSERRAGYGESSEVVRSKAQACISAGLTAIICVGETEEERLTGRTHQVVGSQLSDSLPQSANERNAIIAYEPVWAIGTGRTASSEQIEDVHAFVRTQCAEVLGASAASNVTIVYGGSVNPGNAAEIFGIKDVDGGLVGGASLNGDDFAAVVNALPE